MENNNGNRNQSYQDWNQTDQLNDRNREYQNRNQRFGNYDSEGSQNYNQGWQNTNSGGSNDQYRGSGNQYENQRRYFEDLNRRNSGNDYDQNRWRNNDLNNRNYNQNSEHRNQGSDYSNNRNSGERDWWDRTSDEVASWFGDDDAERRRRMDKVYGPHKGKGPKGYTRTDERITEDVNDKLYHDSYVDASNIEVTATDGEVILSGIVDKRETKRRAEDLAESVTGVKNVQNHLRVNNTSGLDNSNIEADQNNGRKKSSWLS